MMCVLLLLLLLLLLLMLLPITFPIFSGTIPSQIMTPPKRTFANWKKTSDDIHCNSCRANIIQTQGSISQLWSWAIVTACSIILHLFEAKKLDIGEEQKWIELSLWIFCSTTFMNEKLRKEGTWFKWAVSCRMIWFLFSHCKLVWHLLWSLGLDSKLSLSPLWMNSLTRLREPRVFQHSVCNTPCSSSWLEVEGVLVSVNGLPHFSELNLGHSLVHWF